MRQDIMITSRADAERLTHALAMRPFRNHVRIGSPLLSTAQRVRLERKIERILSMCGCASGGVAAILSAAAALSCQITQLRLEFSSVLYAATITLGALILGGIGGKLLGITVQRARLEIVRRHLLRVLGEG